MLTEIAEVLDKHDDAEHFRALAADCRDAMRRTYFADGHYCEGIQGADAYALDIGLLPDSAADDLAANYDALGHFDTGFLGTDILLRVLFAHGHADTALRLLESEDRGSFLYMKRHGATTLWEDWHGGNSHNHPMFGAPARLLYTGFLGIRCEEPGWNRIVIAPQMPVTLACIEGTLDTPRGKISVSLKREDGMLCASVTLPAGTVGVFRSGVIETALHAWENLFKI